VVQGTLEDMNAIDRAVAGAQYVISAAWSPSLSQQSLFMNKAVKQIVESMRKHGVERLVYQAGDFSPVPNVPNSFMGNALRSALGMTLMLKDNDAVIGTLWVTKDVEWVVTRPGYVRDIPSKGKLKAVDKVPFGAITFADLGEFNLKAVQTKACNYDAPYLAY
jgi:NAD(P)H-binding